MARRIVVIGGSGYLGQRVVRLLAQSGDVEPIVMTRNPAELETDAHVITADLGDPESYENTLRQADGVICLAPATLEQLRALAKACHEGGVRRILVTTCATPPLGANAAQRQAHYQREKAITTSELDWTLLRCSIFYGGQDDTTVRLLIRHLRHRRLVVVPGSAFHFIQPCHVDDAAQAVVKAFFADASYHKVYNLSGSKPVSVGGLVLNVSKHLHTKPVIIGLPRPLYVLFWRTVGRLLFERRFALFMYRLGMEKALDSQMTRADLGWLPRALDLALADMTGRTPR